MEERELLNLQNRSDPLFCLGYSIELIIYLSKVIYFKFFLRRLQYSASRNYPDRCPGYVT